MSTRSHSVQKPQEAVQIIKRNVTETGSQCHKTFFFFVNDNFEISQNKLERFYLSIIFNSRQHFRLHTKLPPCQQTIDTNLEACQGQTHQLTLSGLERHRKKKFYDIETT